MDSRDRFKKNAVKSRASLKRLLLVSIGVIIVLAIIILLYIRQAPSNKSQVQKNMSYNTNIIKETRENQNFRRVLFTGQNSQLVVMSIPPGGEVGAETHKYTEQTLFFLSGTGEGELNGKKFPIIPGDVVVVVSGTEHNFRNTGTQDLKIYTVYSPPNHIDGRVHHTKADADADTADEAIGETAPENICNRK
jgi:mannose-6-phosphate isomerase-like protein (cupin superfamily)